MKKAFVPIILIALVCSLAFAAGCGEEQAGVEESDAVNEPRNQAPGEKELGFPIYPGATYRPDLATDGPGGAGYEKPVVTGTDFSTTDGFDQVAGWYRGELGEPTRSYETTATWTSGDPLSDNLHSLTVVLAAEGDVMILIANGSAW